MLKTVFVVAVVLVFAFLSIFVTSFYYFPYSIRLFATLMVFIVTYAVKYFLDRWVAKRVFAKKAQFSFRRVVNVLYFIAIVIALLVIWVQDVSILFVSSGIIGAGIAIALQDVFRSMAGGILVLVNRNYKIGDRIEVDGKYGDVLDIGLFNTTLLEIKEWVEGDQTTGRITTMPNSFVLSKVFDNYNREYSYIWDEIVIPITYDSDWKEAYAKIMGLVQEETKATAEQADKALAALGEKYYISKRYTNPHIYVSLTDNWINFKIRYTTEINVRRTVNSKLSQRILEEIQKSQNIHIASTTMSVSGQIRLDNEKVNV